MPKLEQMFDPEVLVKLRETFDRADAGASLPRLAAALGPHACV